MEILLIPVAPTSNVGLMAACIITRQKFVCRHLFEFVIDHDVDHAHAAASDVTLAFKSSGIAVICG
jgi:hypothetical protein